MRVFAYPIILLCAIFTIHATHAQAPPIITAETVGELGSVYQLDFADVRALGLQTGSGVFVSNQDASVILSFANAEGEPPLSTAVIWDGESGVLRDTLFIGQNAYDRDLSADGKLLAVARQEGIVVFDLETKQGIMEIPAQATVLEVWIYANNGEAVVCGETAALPEQPAQIICSDGRPPIDLFADQASNDFVRIGRVPPPLAITSTESGLVKRWNLETATVSAQADAGEIAVFGATNINAEGDDNASGSHLAWRDPMSEALYMLDLEADQNRQVATLDGAFIAYLLLSPNADVIFGIDPMSDRGAVMAWLSQTGEALRLGTYRNCEKVQPDLAMLSSDGSTLIIGCDMGLDIWRVMAPNE